MNIATANKLLQNDSEYDVTNRGVEFGMIAHATILFTLSLSRRCCSAHA